MGTGRAMRFAFAGLLLILAGCSKEYDLLRVDVRSVIPMQRPTYATHSPPRVAVVPFTDHRPREERWYYHRTWGPPIPIFVKADLGELVTLATIDYLNRHEGWDTWLEKDGVANPAVPAEFRLAGQVLSWHVETDDYFAGKKMTIRIQLWLSVTNLSTNYMTFYVLPHQASRWLIRFNTQHVEAALYEALKATLDIFVRRLHSDLAMNSDVVYRP